MEEQIKKIILLGENITTEFKNTSNELPKNLFETICAFLNTIGGYIILGVNDQKEIIGIDESIKDKLKKDFTSLCNNKEVIYPTVILQLNEISINKKILLYVEVEESDEIHKTKNKIFVRNHEGDFDISDNIPLISSIYRRKKKMFDEEEIYPQISVENDLRHDLIDRARNLANRNVFKDHPWVNMTDLELLKSANLYRTNKITKESGITLAGIMLFGKDEIIREINPYCRTDALLRIDDLERYDDRDFIQTNLLEMYDRLLDFIGKYTMDRFALDNEGKTRISPRNIMAREMVINSLMHRDITDGHTSRIIIYKDKIICENPNNFRTYQNITLENYKPFAKNPTLANFFREIGYADELGSGVRKITENSLKYSGKLPIFEDNETFTLTIPLLRDRKIEEDEIPMIDNSGTVSGTVNGTVNGILKLTENQEKILKVIKDNPQITQKKIYEISGIPLRTIKRNIDVLKNKEIIKRIGSDKKGYWQIIKK